MELRRKGVVLFYDALAWDNIEGECWKGGRGNLKRSCLFASMFTHKIGLSSSDKHVIAGIAVAIEQAVFESAGKTTGDAYRASKPFEFFCVSVAFLQVSRINFLCDSKQS